MCMSAHNQSQTWKDDIAAFEKPDTRKGVWQLANSVIPYVALWILAAVGWSESIWITIGCALLAAGFFMRIFIIFHDCCHHSFFGSRKANDRVGTLTGFLTLFPYQKWKYEHSVHHATSGNLDRKGVGDIWTLTVREYLSATPFKRFVYRVYRHPLVMFGFGPIYLFLYSHRFNRKGAGRKERMNTYATNAVAAAVYGLLIWRLGWQEVLCIQGVILYSSGIFGIWLFYVQHQFEDTYFEPSADWDYIHAAVEGSSFYKLPTLLQWITGNIGFHHVHHLRPRVPNYHLQMAHESSPVMQKVPAVGFRSSLRSLRHRVWDEENKRFLRFAEVMRANAPTGDG